MTEGKGIPEKWNWYQSTSTYSREFLKNIDVVLCSLKEPIKEFTELEINAHLEVNEREKRAGKDRKKIKRKNKNKSQLSFKKGAHQDENVETIFSKILCTQTAQNEDTIR